MREAGKAADRLAEQERGKQKPAKAAKPKKREKEPEETPVEENVAVFYVDGYEPTSEWGFVDGSDYIFADPHYWIDFETEIVPNWEHIRFLVGYTHDARDGSKQAISGSKCANCHQVSMTRELDRKRRDLRAGAKLTYTGFTLGYEYLDRKFEENGPTPTFTPPR